MDFFEVVFRETLPLMYHHFEGLDIRTIFYFPEWTRTLFVHHVPMRVTLRLWDALIVRGEAFVLQVALGLLKYYEPELMRASFEEAIRILHAHLSSESPEVEAAFCDDFFFQCVEACPVWPSRLSAHLSRVDASISMEAFACTPGLLGGDAPFAGGGASV
eukprot:Polyplicarium_translucidae@DN4595_c0_g1_i1.p1